MAERKVINKYYPPDFDPAKIPRKQSKTQLQIKVRTMLSMSIRCETCGSYISKGTKFNSRKERVIGETYLGIQIFRFYFKCNVCSAEIVIKTDPQSSDYVIEAGARRVSQDHEDQKNRQVMMGDAAVGLLEIRRLASKRETKTVLALHELKSLKSRNAHVHVDSMLEALQPSAQLQKQQQLEEARPIVDDELQTITKKRKPSYYYLTTKSIPKKPLVVSKTQESSNGLVLLCQEYDCIDDQEA